MTSSTAQQHADKVSKVEKIGIFFEKLNLPPVASRVLAFLLINDTPHASFDEIRDFLGTSKSSISNAIKYLIQDHRIDYITFNRDRKRYFKANPKLWRKSMEEKVDDWKHSIEFLTGILEERKKNEISFDFNRALDETIKFETYVHQKMAQAIADWEKMTSMNIVATRPLDISIKSTTAPRRL